MISASTALPQNPALVQAAVTVCKVIEAVPVGRPEILASDAPKVKPVGRAGEMVN